METEGAGGEREPEYVHACNYRRYLR
jgi:hypothetical protein